MNDRIDPASAGIEEPAEDAILTAEIPDESLEAAAAGGVFGIYTEFAYCTQVACPGG